MTSAVDFETGLATQFNGLPTLSNDSFYTYPSYNNWTTKVPAPLAAQSFWPVVPTRHHQSPSNCFNSVSSVPAVSMSGPANSSLPTAIANTLANSSSSITSQHFPYATYTTSSNPYSMYHNRSAEPCTVVPSSIAAVRFRTKQHTDFVSYPSATTPIISSSANLQACQYATSEAKAWLRRELGPWGPSDET